MRDHEPADAPQEPRPFQVFLCHCSEDKPRARRVHARLKRAGLRPWLDEVDLQPGDDWEPATRDAVRAADIVLVLLSPRSVDKDGFVQKEIGFALDRAEEKPEGKPYIIPVKLEPCELPRRLRRWQSADWYRRRGQEALLARLLREAEERLGPRVGLPVAAPPAPAVATTGTMANVPVVTEFRTLTNPKDGSELVLVPAGEFEMGDGQEGDCPKHTVYLDAYYIGRYCVTNAQYARFVEETGQRAPRNGLWQEAAKADHPVTDVSWDDAQAYAAWAGLPLPTEAQWERAARGPANTLYPWGDDWDASRCRNSANRGSETTAAVDEYPSGISGYGTYQQSGNVWEWCADWYDDDYYQQSSRANPTGPTGGSSRVARGGGWRYGHASDCRGAYREWLDSAFRDGNLGFRLVRAAVLVPPGGGAARSDAPGR